MTQLSIRDFRPLEAMTPEQQAAIDNATGADGSLLGAAFGNTGVTKSLIGRMAAGWNFTDDDNFKLTPDRVEKLGKGLPVEWWDDFERAGSEDQAVFIREQLLQRQSDRQKLAGAGWTGLGLQMAAGLTDPLELIAQIGANAVIPGSGIVARGGSALKNAARAGLIFGATDAALMAADDALSPDDYSAAEYSLAVLGSFTLGGALEYRSLLKAEHTAAAVTPHVFDDGTLGGILEAAADADSIRKAEEILGIVRLSRDEHLLLQARKAAAANVESMGAADIADAAIKLNLAQQAERAAKAERFNTLLAQWRKNQKSGRVSADGTNIDAVLRNIEAWEKQYEMPAPMARTSKGELLYADAETANAAAETLRRNIDRDHTQRRFTEQNIPAETRTVKPTVEVTPAAEGTFRVRISDNGTTTDAMPYIAKTAQARLGLAEAQARLAKARKDIEFDLLVRQSGGIDSLNPTDKGKAYFKQQLADAALSDDDFIRRGVTQLTPEEIGRLIEETQPQFKPVTSPVAMGASSPADIIAATEAAEELAKRRAAKDIHDFDAAWAKNAPIPAARGGTLSIAGLTGRSESEEVRRFSRIAVEHVRLDTEGNPIHLGASEIKRREQLRLMGEMGIADGEAFEAWGKAKGIQTLVNPKARLQFQREVYHTIRNSAKRSSDPAVQKIVANHRKFYADWLARAKRLGIPGFENVAENPNYIARIFRKQLIDRMVATFGEEQTIDLILGSLFSGRPDIDPKLARRIAKGYYNRIQRIGEVQPASLHALFNSDAREALAANLRELVENITEDEIASVLGAFKRVDDGSTGTIPRAQRRLALNDDYQHPTLKWEDGSPVRFDDMLEQDALAIARSYNDDMLGAMLMDEIYYTMTPRGKAKFRDRQSLMDFLADDMRAAGVAEDGWFGVRASLEKIDTMIRHIEGRPLPEGGMVSHAFASTAANYNIARLMGRAGVAQMGELGGQLAENGMRSTLQAAPGLKEIVSLVRTGQFTDEMAMEIQAMIGTGQERFLTDFTARMGGAFSDSPIDTGGRMGRAKELASQGSRLGARAALKASLMTDLDAALRMMHAKGMLHTWAKIAHANRLPSKARLAGMGMDEAMAKRVRDQILAPGGTVTEPGLLGRRMKRLNIESWKDKEAASAFMNAIDRTSRRNVQQNDIGQTALWMNKPTGRLIAQFRGFPIVAWEKQILYQVDMMDAAAGVWLLYGLGTGALSYLAVTHLNAAGKPPEEKAEYLEERLSTKNIALGAWQRSAASSLLPGLIDSSLGSFGLPQQFTQGRSSGLTSDVFFGNPTTDLVKSGRALRLLRAPLDPNFQATQADIRALRNLIPLQNAYGLQQFLDAIQGSFPKYQDSE